MIMFISRSWLILLKRLDWLGIKMLWSVREELCLAIVSHLEFHNSCSVLWDFEQFSLVLGINIFVQEINNMAQ